MLELSKISFTVETKPLEDAVTKIADLGTAVSKLAVDLKKLDKASTDTAVNQKKVELATEKVATQAAKTAEVLDRAETKKQKAIEKTTKATKEAQVVQTGLVDSIERKRDLISEGWTRGESSVLKMAEAMGIAGGEMERLKGLLRDIGGLASNPFDSTLGSLRSIQKEFDGLVLRSKLVDQGIELTTTQLKQFARIAAEASVAVKKMGMDPTEGAGLVEYNKLLTQSQDEYLKVAVASKSLLDGEKLLAKQHRDTASAKSFLIKEDERMLSVTEQLNNGTNRSVSISEKAAIATANYARALKTAGVAGDEAKTRLAKYSAAQQLASEKEEQRAAANLARALQPQATDVLVSLWSGQSPLTVMLQQGGQVVDLFKLSGVEANKLGTTMKAAFAGMLPSIVAVGGAIGGLLLDGVVAAGSAVTGLVSKMFLIDKATDLIRKQIIELSDDFDVAGKRIESFDKLAAGFGKAFSVAAISFIAILALVAVEMYRVMKAQSELNIALASTGASLGLSNKEAIALATSYETLGVSSMKGIAIMTEVAKAGNLEAEMFSTIAKSASEMQKYAGQSIEDTVKQFSKLADEPSKALTEIAIKTGYITVEVLEQVAALEQQGKMVEAVQLAQEAYGESNTAIANEIKANLSTLEKAWFDIKSAIGAVQQVLFEFATNTIVVEAFGKAWAVSAGFISESWWLIKEIGKTLGATASAYISFMSGDFKGALNIGKERLSDLKASREEQNKYIQSLLKGNSVNQESAKLAADEREKNSKHAKWTADNAKAMEKSLSKEEKFAIKVNELQKDLTNNTITEEKYVQAILGWKRLILGEDNKEKKAPKPKADKVENYFDKIKERVNDLKIDVEGYVLELTKSEKLLKDLQDDKQWKAAPETRKGEKAALEAELGILAAKERQNVEAEKHKKVQEEITKIQQSTTEFITKQEQENSKLTSGYSLQLELLGKSEEEQKKIKDAYELQGKLQKINYEFAKKELDVKEKYDALIRKGLNQRDMVAAMEAEQAELAKLDQARGEALGVIYQGVAVQASVDYYNEMQKVASELAGVISTALFEGGQAGTKKLRDYIVNLFRKKIEVWIEANIMGALTGGSSGGSTGSVGGIAGMAQSVSTALGLAGTFGSSIASGLGATLSGSMGTAISAGLANIGAGTSSAIASGLGSIAGALAPYALAAVALYSLFREKEYVKGTGSANLAFDAAGNTTQKNTFTKDFEIQTNEADKFVETMQSSYTSLARTLGIDSKGGAFSYGSNNSDGGKFSVGANVGSGSYFKTDIKASPEALQLEASRAVFAALKGSELPAYMVKLFNTVTAETASAADIEGVLKYASTLKSVRDNLTETRTPLEVFKDNLNKAFVVLGTTSEQFKTDFVAAIDKGIGPDALATWMAAGDAMAALTEEADKLADTNKALQDELDVLTGKETERSLQLRDATDESTKALIRQIHEQEDLKEAAEKAADAIKEVSFNVEEWLKWDKVGVSSAEQFEAYNKVEELRKKAADNYFKAQEAVTQAQQQLVGALQDTIKSFEDFLATLDNASSPVDRLATARQEFNDLSVRARAGDTEAIGQLTTSGKKFLDLSKGYSKSIVDYRRDEAQVRILLKEGIKVGKEELAKLPAELQKSSDPLAKAYADLAKATADEESARVLAIAMQADLSKSEEDLAKQYQDLIKLLPNGKAMQKFFDDTFAAVKSAADIAKTAAAAAQAILNSLVKPPASGGGSAMGPNLNPGEIPKGEGIKAIDDSLAVEDTLPTADSKYSSIKQGQDQYKNMLAASGVNNSTGNSIDVFNSGVARMYTSQGVQYASVFEFAKILQDYAEINGKEATKEFALNYGANDSVLAEFRKYTAGPAKFETGGYHSGGFRTVGESGIELEATGPSRIFNASQTASILQPKIQDNSRTEMLIEKLIDVCKTASSNNTLENNQIIPAVKKMANYMDRWNVIGVPTKELAA